MVSWAPCEGYSAVEGQTPMAHLEADLHAVVEWADQKRRRWAFSDRNAGSQLVAFSNDLADLGQLNWPAITANQWSDATIKEGKQAEFLVHESFPWRFVERVGVRDNGVADQVHQAIAEAAHRPKVAVERGWYY